MLSFLVAFIFLVTGSLDLAMAKTSQPSDPSGASCPYQDVKEVQGSKIVFQEDAFDFGQIPTNRKVTHIFPLAMFKQNSKEPPVEGKRVSWRGVPWPVKVLKVETEGVLLDLSPETETRVPAPIGYARVTYDDQTITTTMVIQAGVGDQLTSRNGQQATVVALDDKSMTLDFNHPLAGKRVTFEVTVAELTQQPMVTIPGLKKWENTESHPLGPVSNPSVRNVICFRYNKENPMLTTLFWLAVVGSETLSKRHQRK